MLASPTWPGAADFVEVPEFSIDFGTVMARMNRMRDNAGMTEWLRTMADFFAEYAHFVSDHEVQGDRVVSGRHAS
ncbi:MAG: hypothetical protein R2697_00070 [Ilumatobacteraceae bacterium]